MKVEIATANAKCESAVATIPELIALDSLLPSRRTPAKSPRDASARACGYLKARAPIEVPMQDDKLLAPRITHNASPGSRSM